MIQGKLGSLVGRSSGYVESLPAPVRRRVAGLKGVQKDHSKLEAEFQEEVLELEKKYFAKFTPLYEKRAKIVNGAVEPTEDEIKAGEEDDEEEDAAGTCKIVPRFSIPCIERDLWAVIQSLASICSPICVELADVLSEPIEKGPETSDVKGIPEFWLSAMKNQGKWTSFVLWCEAATNQICIAVSLAEMITDRDEAALKDLTDVQMEYLDKPGFRLIFQFAENEFFNNKTITKTYFYQNESGYGGDFIYDHAEGDKIDWKAGKDLTVRIESKKQRNKSKLNDLKNKWPS